MKRIVFYLDFISPYAYLAFEKLPEALQGLSYAVDYKPVLFAAMLQKHGQLGPAEIKPKRDWTYRQALWIGHSQGIPIELPSMHPFNPLALLRLALACGQGGSINRYVAETVFRHAWRAGSDPTDVERLALLRQQLAPARDPAGDEVKQELKSNTDAAVAMDLFGVPTMAVDDKLFWGFDSLPMLRAYLDGDPWFDARWNSGDDLPVGVNRSAGPRGNA